MASFSPDMHPDVLVLGCGFTGRAVARLARERGLRVLVTVRSEAHATELRGDGLDVLVTPIVPALAAHAGAQTHIVVCFPPDGTTDAIVAPALGATGASIAYVSTTGVYGDGAVDDTTPVVTSARSAARLDAEAAWRAEGATVLRCPGIYGADRGLHMRVIRGEHRLPGDGSLFTSRIHVDDLAVHLLATRAVRGETFVVGDLEPAAQAEICRWICAHHGVPFPPSVPIETVHETLRSDRRVDGARARERLGVTLRYPSYRDGMA